MRGSVCNMLRSARCLVSGVPCHARCMNPCGESWCVVMLARTKVSYAVQLVYVELGQHARGLAAREATLDTCAVMVCLSARPLEARMTRLERPLRLRRRRAERALRAWTSRGDHEKFKAAGKRKFPLRYASANDAMSCCCFLLRVARLRPACLRWRRAGKNGCESIYPTE